MYNNKSIELVKKILKTNRTNYWTGNQCNLFEKEFSNYIGNKYSISVSNGSVALEIALNALNLKKNDQVIVTPRSFIISASCVLNLGLKPVFSDIDRNGNLSFDGIKNVYNKNVKAIILVHLKGLSCDLSKIIDFVKKKNYISLKIALKHMELFIRVIRLDHLELFRHGLFVKIKLFQLEEKGE